MALSAWFCDIATGVVVGQAPLMDGDTFTAKIGGGPFTARVNLAQYRTRSGAPDADMIDKILGYCIGGKYTLLVTDGKTVLGEWLLWTRKQPTDSGILTISGFEWDDYPQYRSLHNNLRYTDLDLGGPYKQLFDGLFVEYQPPGMRFTVPTWKLGIKATVNRDRRTCYYSDVLGDLDDLDPGIEWRVKITCSWNGDLPKQVSRTIIYAKGELATKTSHVLVKPQGDRRGGNTLSFDRSRDHSKMARSVYGWGAGEGGKQRFAEAQDYGLTDEGYIAVTRNIQFSGEFSDKALQAKTNKVQRMSYDPWEPTQATVDMRRMTGYPQIGDLVHCDIAWSWTLPHGYQGDMRIGQITYTIGSPLISLELAEVTK